jgi:tRNA dimethylallyltransferase
VKQKQQSALPVVLGPTASGKSELAIHIALEFGGEIVSCDSLQIYRGFDIGTAKVPEAERHGIPHHMIDVVEPTGLYTAGEYSRAARQVLHEISARGRTPVVVGGTGFYLRALLEGLFPGPQRNEALRAKLEQREQRRPGSLHRILSRLDPESAARIHSNDRSKIIRALEVRLLEGAPITGAFHRGRAALQGYRAIKLGLNPPRALLYERMNTRTSRIFEQGLVEEVRGLLAAGVPKHAKPFESLGYKQALAMLEGRLTAQEALASTQLETRRYAKRQLTWFRKEQNVHWLRGFGDDPAVQQQAITILRREF